jgi:hypothetical protein
MTATLTDRSAGNPLVLARGGQPAGVRGRAGSAGLSAAQLAARSPVGTYRRVAAMRSLLVSSERLGLIVEENGRWGLSAAAEARFGYVLRGMEGRS